MNFRYVSLWLLFLLLSHQGWSQIDVTVAGKSISLSKKNIRFFLIDSLRFDDAIVRDSTVKWGTLGKDPIPIKNFPQTVYLCIPLDSFLTSSYLEITDPNINYIQVWILSPEGTVIKKFPFTGDKNNYNTRPVDYTSFLFPIEAYQKKGNSILIATDKRHVFRVLPVDLKAQTDLFGNNQHTTFFQGLIIGVIAFFTLFVAYLWISVRQTVFFWYLAYLLNLALYFFVDSGLFFKYITPNYPQLNESFGPLLLGLLFLPFTIYFLSLTEVKNHFPKIGRWNTRLTGFYAIIWVVSFLTSFLNNYQLNEFWVSANKIVSPTFLLYFYGLSIFLFFKKIKFSGFVVASYTIILVFTLLLAAFYNGKTPNAFAYRYSLYIGFFFDVLIMAWATVYRFKMYLDESERLAAENAIQQQQIFQTLSDFKEKEMQRFSSFLHDSLGAYLFSVRKKLEKAQQTEHPKELLEKAEREIIQLSKEVRSYSHEFSPLLFQRKGLLQSLEELVDKIQHEQHLKIQFEKLGSLSQVPYRYELLMYTMVQELLQNTLKHAQAQKAILQILLEHDSVSIYMEDDGIGFSKTELEPGLGFTQIHQLITFLRGTIQINSSPHKGVIISIEIPIKHHEN
jgi:signal transduction histidine kinase